MVMFMLGGWLVLQGVGTVIGIRLLARSGGLQLRCPTRGEIFERRARRKQRWKIWFAWQPVRLENGECAWLRRVWCRGCYHAGHDYDQWRWVYLPLGATRTEFSKFSRWDNDWCRWHSTPSIYGWIPRERQFGRAT